MVVFYLMVAELAKQGFYRWAGQVDQKKKRARDIVG
jgi:Mg2+-importing ATPase